MEDNVWVFVCTHGRFGEELIKSAEMIAGETENVFSFSLLPGMPPEDYRSMLEQQLEKLQGGKVLCLVDLFEEHRVRRVQFCQKPMICRYYRIESGYVYRGYITERELSY